MSIRRILPLAVLCGSLFCVSHARAFADSPEGVQRTFIVLVNSLEQAPDFFGEQSLGLVVRHANPQVDTTIFRFANSNCDARFNATVWEHRDAMHITKGSCGDVPGFVAWLLTPDTPNPPPNGAFTFSGPDSPLILSQEVFYFETSSTGLRLRCSPGGAGVLVLVTAIFSR